MGETYLFWNGLVKAAEDAKGNENISIGIRPYGFHAGNELTLFTYPWHFCNLVKEMGKKVNFTFFISINDMEPEGLKYLYKSKTGDNFYKREEFTLKEEVPFEYNVFVKDTSFQYTPDKEDCCKSMAVHWEKIIEQKLLRLKNDFPDITINLVRSSSLKNNPEYKTAITLGVMQPNLFGKIVNDYDRVCFEEGWLSWAGAICSNCGFAQGKTSIHNGTVLFNCDNCRKVYKTDFDITDFWAHHMLLLAPRLKILNINIFFRGFDHYECKHIPMNERLYELLYGVKLDIKTIVPPIIVRDDGKKMSKTWSNEKIIESDKLKDLAKNNISGKIIL